MTLTALNPMVAEHLRGARAGTEIEAVILAAGRGSRLLAATAKRPKCLVEVGGVPLIEHQLRLLELAGIDRVSIVVGYRAEEVCTALRGQARVIRNSDWARTNSLYSLSLCHRHVGASMLVLNCDVLVHPLALQRLLSTPGSGFLYDSSSGTAEEHMKVEMVGGRLAAMSKALPAHRRNGENVGVLYFEPTAARMLLAIASGLVAHGLRKMWMAAAVERLAQLRPLQGVDIADLPWIEIDFPDDLDRAHDQVWPHVRHALARWGGRGAEKPNRAGLLP